MQSIHLIRDNLERSEDIVLSRVEEMRDHCVVFPTPRGGCHTLWVLGHLAYIEALVIRSFMLGEPNPLADWEEVFDGVDTSGDIEQFLPFDQVLTHEMPSDTCVDDFVARLFDRRRPRSGERGRPGWRRRALRHLPTMFPVRCRPLVHAPRATG